MSVQYLLPRSTRRNDFIAVGGQSVFGPTTWISFDLTDVRVRVRQADGRFATVTAGWSASGASPQQPGAVTVTFNAPQAAGTVIRVESVRIHPRTTDVTRAGALQSAAVERELDLVSTVLQELRRDISTVETETAADLDRTLRAPAGTAFLPIAGIAPSRGIAFDGAGQPVAVPFAGSMATINAVQVIDSTPAGRALLTASTTGAQRDALGLSGLRIVDTTAAMLAMTLTGATGAIMTLGHLAIGDGGGGMWRRLGAAPGIVRAYHRQVDGSWFQFCDLDVAPLMLGAAADNVADDSAILQACCDHVMLNGRGRVDLQRRLYRSAAQVNLPNGLYFGNGALRLTTNFQKGLRLAGVESAAVALSTAAPRFQDFVFLSVGHGLAVDDWVYVASDDAWSKNDNAGAVGGATYCRKGEIHRVRLVGSNFVYFYSRLRYGYATNATIRKLTYAEAKLHDLTITGNNDPGKQYGVELLTCQADLRNLRIERCGDRAIQMLRNRNGYAENIFCANETGTAGYPYGIACGNASQDMLFVNVEGIGQKHLITFGNTDGVDYNLTARDCTAYDGLDAGFDVHAGSAGVTFENCHVRGPASQNAVAGYQYAGFTLQGAKMTLRGCSATALRFGVIVQLFSDEDEDFVDIDGMTIPRIVADGTALDPNYICSFQNIKWGGSIRKVALDITGNAFGNFQNGIEVRNYSGAPTLGGLTINGNILTSGRALAISPGTTQIANWKFFGTFERTNNSGYCIDINVSAANLMPQGRIMATILGGNTGLSNTFAAPNITGSIIQGWTASAIGNAGILPIAQRDTCTLTA